VPSHPPFFFLIGREQGLSEVRRDRVACSMAGVEVGQEIDLGKLPSPPTVGRALCCYREGLRGCEASPAIHPVGKAT